MNKHIKAVSEYYFATAFSFLWYYDTAANDTDHKEDMTHMFSSSSIKVFILLLIGFIFISVIVGFVKGAIQQKRANKKEGKPLLPKDRQQGEDSRTEEAIKPKEPKPKKKAPKRKKPKRL